MQALTKQTGPGWSAAMGAGSPYAVASWVEQGERTGLSVICNEDGIFAVDSATGEIVISIKAQPERVSVGREVALYVGIDTRFPSEAREPEELREALAVHDCWGNQPHISSYNILQLLETGMSVDAVRIFKCFAEGLAGRNYWFGRLSDLDQLLGLSSRTRMRAVGELVRANLIDVKPQGRALPTRVSVHPWYAYCGDIMGIEPATADWVKRNRRNADSDMPNMAA